MQLCTCQVGLLMQGHTARRMGLNPFRLKSVANDLQTAETLRRAPSGGGLRAVAAFKAIFETACRKLGRRASFLRRFAPLPLLGPGANAAITNSRIVRQPFRLTTANHAGATRKLPSTW